MAVRCPSFSFLYFILVAMRLLLTRILYRRRVVLTMHTSSSFPRGRGHLGIAESGFFFPK